MSNPFGKVTFTQTAGESLVAGSPVASTPVYRQPNIAPRPQQVGMLDEELANVARGGQPRPQPQVEVTSAQAQPASNIKPYIVAAGIAVAALALYLVISTVISFLGTKADDLAYGRPRTFQMDAFVGHDEGAGTPSHFIAINLNHQISVIELPGGDVTKARAISGPYLFGADGDLTPVMLEVRDLNADQRPDLLVSIKNEQVVYINSGSDFHLMTAEERAAIGAAAGK